MSEENSSDILKYLEALLTDDGSDSNNHQLDRPTQSAVQLINRIASCFDANKLNQSTFNPGDNWGHLTIEAPIGDGGVGHVYQAFDHVLNRRVAVKFLNKDNQKLISSVDFINEARRLAKIRHPNVMAVFGAQTEHGITGFWAEQLTGIPLSDYELEPLDSTAKLTLMYHLSAAVTAIHRQHIIHADIKPQNIMIERDRGPVLMDFGAGRDISISTGEGINSLTPMAMAPELFKCQTATQASDIYALGIVFYFIVTDGKHPHKASTYNQLKEIVCNPNNHPVGTGLPIPRTWRKLINQMCHYDPDKRLGSQVVMNQLNVLLEAPQKRMKRFALASLMVFLLGSLLVLGTSYVTVNKERHIAKKALQETRSINDLITDFILSVSPVRQGKDVLLVDVLNQFMTDLKESDGISLDSQSQLLSNLASAKFYLGHYDQGINMMKGLMKRKEIAPKLQIDLVLAYTHMIDQHPNMAANTQKAQVRLGTERAQTLINSYQLKEPEHQAKLDYLLGRIAERELKFISAETYFQSALKYWQSIPSSKYTELVQFTLLTSLGNVAAKQGHMNMAETNYQQAFKKAQQHSEIKYNSNLMVAFNNLTIQLAKTGDIHQAIEAFRTLLDKNNQFFGPNHANSITSAINLMSAYNQAEQYSQAHTLIKEYQAYFDSIQENESHSVLHFLSISAITLAGLEKYEEAIKTYHLVIDKYKKSMGDYHPMTLTNQVNLAEIYNTQGHYQQAIDYLILPIKRAENQLGKQHEVTLYMYQTLSLAHQGLKNNKAAFDIMKQVYNARLATLGADHPSTIDTQNNLKQMQQP